MTDFRDLATVDAEVEHALSTAQVKITKILDRIGVPDDERALFIMSLFTVLDDYNNKGIDKKFIKVNDGAETQWIWNGDFNEESRFIYTIASYKVAAPKSILIQYIQEVLRPIFTKYFITPPDLKALKTNLDNLMPFVDLGVFERLAYWFNTINFGQGKLFGVRDLVLIVRMLDIERYDRVLVPNSLFGQLLGMVITHKRSINTGYSTDKIVDCIELDPQVQLLSMFAKVIGGYDSITGLWDSQPIGLSGVIYRADRLILDVTQRINNDEWYELNKCYINSVVDDGIFMLLFKKDEVHQLLSPHIDEILAKNTLLRICDFDDGNTQALLFKAGSAHHNEVVEELCIDTDGRHLRVNSCKKIEEVLNYG